MSKSRREKVQRWRRELEEREECIDIDGSERRNDEGREEMREGAREG